MYKSKLKKGCGIISLLLTLVVLSAILYERYVLTGWYNFKLSEYEIEIMSDECEMCYLDWTIIHTIQIEDTKRDLEAEIEFYTEGPRLEFGFNKSKTQMVINCPGFSTKFINLYDFSEDLYQYEELDQKLNEFKIDWSISMKKELKNHIPPKDPDRKWE